MRSPWGAITGQTRIAIGATLGAFGMAYLVNSLLSIADSLDGWTALSPFEWYLGGEPLLNGIEWSSVALFVGFTALSVCAAVVAFDHRDLRKT